MPSMTYSAFRQEFHPTRIEICFSTINNTDACPLSLFQMDPLFHDHFFRRIHFFTVANTEGSAFPPPSDIWGTPPSCRHTSDMCHGRTGRSCSSGDPYTLDS